MINFTTIEDATKRYTIIVSEIAFIQQDEHILLLVYKANFQQVIKFDSKEGADKIHNLLRENLKAD